MGKKSAEIDAYIANAPDYAKPILTRIRRLVHAACPQVEETLKWRFPHFMHHGILCGMAAFKHHCSFGFWHKSMPILSGANGKSEDAMGQYGRITAVSDLPSDAAFKRLVKQAMELNESGVKPPRAAKPKAKKPLRIPDYFATALARNKKARETFENFSPSHKREYVDWIVEAKREETRLQRLKTALEWLAEGKSRNWKYERC